jgi:glycerol transport system ATP-binding protein
MGLTLQNVNKVVGGAPHLRDVNLDFEAGSRNVLLGRTLAGKTSLLRIMAGLDRPTSGKIIVDGKDMTGVSVRKRSVAMVYQQFINYPSFTVYENIAAPLRRAGLDKRDIDRKVRETADTLRIGGLLDRLPGELSGGQQQRTALARALVKEADLLLLDEPLINLDYKLREELRSELQAIFSGRDSVVVYATTEPLEALMLQGTTVVMAEGRVLQAGPTLEVFHHPASVDVGDVFSDPPMNMIDGRIEGGTATLGTDIVVPVEGHLAGLPPGPYRFGVRANHLFVVAENRGPDPLRRGGRTGGNQRLGNLHPRHPQRRVMGRPGGRRSFLQPRPADPGLPESPPPVRVRRGGTAGGRAGSRRRDTEWTPGGAMARIHLDGIAHSYTSTPKTDADWALKRLDLTWRDGGAYALLGPSGCGKTTLAQRHLRSGSAVGRAGHLRRHVDVTELSTERRNIAQVFQFPVIYDTMTVFENLAFPLRNRGVGAADTRARVEEVAGMLGLTPDLHKKARGLTADSKQKISLGRGPRAQRRGWPSCSTNR